MKGINVLKKLKVLYMSNNMVKDWSEFAKLNELPLLVELIFVGNPLEEKCSSEGPDIWKRDVTKRLPNLKKLEGIPIIHGGDEEE